MRYKVYDEEDKKERTLEECVTPLEVGSVRRVQVKKGLSILIQILRA